jgi:hypothetical protein
VLGNERLVDQFDERLALICGQISVDMDLQNPDMACQNAPDPEVDERVVQPQEPAKIKLALVEDEAGVTEEKQLVHEAFQLLDAPECLNVGDTEARDEPPEVAPATGEHARPHGLRRLEEPNHMMQ